ncbi:hypothetical protein B7494_g5114 [Chlorociboria aeruginascens]|nr:hypothetical protein B7494_g5114 [Chlorociboria aeruginascens]
MDILPFESSIVAPTLLSVYLVRYRSDLLLFSRPTYLGTFILLWLLQFFLWAFWKVILFPHFFSPTRHLPGPSGGSIWNGQLARIRAEPSGAPMADWVNSIPNNGLMRYLGILNSERIIATSPEALREVLSTNSYDFCKPPELATGLGRILGVGVLLAEGEEHKRQRKNLMPAFAFRHIKDLYPLFWAKSREAVTAMTEDVTSKQNREAGDEKDTTVTNGEVVLEAGNWASRATLDIIGVAGMGHDFGAIKDPNTVLNRTYKSILAPSRASQILGLLNMILPFWFVKRLPVKRNGEIEAAAEVIRTVCRQLIREKKEKLEKKELNDVDIISVALESGGFTEENLVDQCMTFLLAGHETTASSMTWAIYMLCLHPEVQTRLRAEIRENLPNIEEDVNISSQDIDRMPYLNAVVNEVLRYYPPVPLTIRQAARNTTILGEHIPKGTRIVLAPWAVNKDEKLWGPSARKFDPERWLYREGYHLSNSGGAESNYAFLTFLHGPRGCIGQGFAKAEFACLLAAWIGRFQFELKNKAELDEKNMLIKGGVTARPTNGLHVITKVVPGW